jgi:outer membrane protein OmpA-like peptidoglycan-associated protein
MRFRVVVAMVAWATVAEADPLELQLKNQVPAGQKPSLTLTAQAPVASVKISLTRAEDRKAFAVTHGAMRQGQVVTLPFGDTRAGRYKWNGTLETTFPDGNRSTTQLTFETAAVGELHVTYRRDRLDLEARTLEFQLSRPAGKAELKVFGDDGAEIGQGEATYNKEPPGTWLRIGWTQKPGNVLKLELRATDTDGVGVLVKLLPWSVRIPHEEVVFATGQSVIAPSEIPKLDAGYARIVDAVDRVRKADPQLPVKLFIAGHTDTVGAPADNRRLSLDRARAIAAWYRGRGLPIPIAYAGFGEDALKVKTPDNTDQAANRRADYIVGVEEPLVARGIAASWQALK